MQTHVGKAVGAGLAGTAAMTLVMLMAPLMGLPAMKIGTMLGMFMGLPAFMGWIAHFMIGIVLALLYAYVFAGRLPGAAGVRGMLYALLPWLMMNIVVFPMMHMGVFASSTESPLGWVMGSVIGHLVYGLVTGAVYGVVRVPTSSFAH